VSSNQLASAKAHRNEPTVEQVVTAMCASMLTSYLHKNNIFLALVSEKMVAVVKVYEK